MPPADLGSLMDHREFRAAITRLFGTEAEAARQLQINPRTMRKYLADPEKVTTSNTLRVNPNLKREILDLLEQYPNGVQMSDPRRAISILHAQMVRNGWSADLAAAGIAGAAMALANAHLSPDAVTEVLTNARPA